MGALGGGLAQGLAQGVQYGQQMQQKQQQQQMMQDYYEIQKQEIKQKSKLEELKLDKEQRELGLTEMFVNLIKAKYGGELPMGQGSQIENQSTTPSVSALPPEQMREEFQKASQYTGVPLPTLLAVARTESSFNPQARGSSGEIGLMQLKPGTAQEMGVTNPNDWTQNLWGGARYLAKQNQRFGGDWDKTLAAYNTGPETVATRGIVPEGQQYIQKVKGAGTAQQVQSQPSGNASDMMRDPLVVAMMNKQMGGKFDYNPGSIKFEETVINGQPVRVPIDNITGRPDYSKALPQPIKYESLDQEDALGNKRRTWVNPYSPPDSVTTTPGGMKPEQAGKQNVILQAQERLGEINQIIFGKGDLQNGDVNIKVLAEAKAGLGEGSILWSKMNQAVWGALRPESGALVSKEEIAQSFQNYMPTTLDLLHPQRDKIVREKMKDFNGYIKGLAALTDPTEQMAFVKRAASGTGVPSLNLGEGKKQPNRMTYDPATDSFK